MINPRVIIEFTKFSIFRFCTTVGPDPSNIFILVIFSLYFICTYLLKVVNTGKVSSLGFRNIVHVNLD